MRLAKELINKPIYTLDEGRLLGKAQDLYVSDELDKVLGLYLGAQGLIRRKADLIQSQNIALFGVDMILVNNAGVITDDSLLPEAKTWMRREKLIGRDVDTPGGTRLGVIGDVVVDVTGTITGFALAKVYVEGPLADKRYIARETVVDDGNEDGRMTVDLPKLEALLSGDVTLPVSAPEAPAEPFEADEAIDIVMTPPEETFDDEPPAAAETTED